MKLFEYPIEQKNLMLVKYPAFSYDLQDFIKISRDFDVQIIANEIMIENYVEDARIRDHKIITDNFLSDQIIVVTSPNRIGNITQKDLLDIHHKIVNHDYKAIDHWGC